jgi:nonsense-mediated mRNA decay protein 3
MSMIAPPPTQCVLSDVWVVPVSELGTSDRQIHCRSHLGHLLHDGDCVWGFDLSQANLNDANLDKMNPADIPDVVLVKKSYGDKVKRSKQRNWQLQMIDREMDVTVATANEKGAEEDYEEFLEDLEEDMIYRKNVNIFFNPGLQTVAVEDGDVSEDVPRVGLEEMLQEMTINDRRD